MLGVLVPSSVQSASPLTLAQQLPICLSARPFPPSLARRDLRRKLAAKDAENQQLERELKKEEERRAARGTAESVEDLTRRCVRRLCAVPVPCNIVRLGDIARRARASARPMFGPFLSLGAPLWAPLRGCSRKPHLTLHHQC